MKVVELFSGIGSQAKALSRIAKKNKLNLEILKTCEWNIHAIVAYDFIHNNTSMLNEIKEMDKTLLLDELSRYKLSSNGKELINVKHLNSMSAQTLRVILNSIKKTNNMVDIRQVKGIDIPDDTDLLTYSFPCQDLSNVGSFHGYKHGIDRSANTRSGLLWEVERILDEKISLGQKLPKFLLLENVNALEAKRHEGNFEEWKDKLTTLGYINYPYRLYAPDFGIPQNRRRLIMLSVYVGNDIYLNNKLKEYWESHDLNNLEYIKSLKIKKNSLRPYLKLDYSNDKLLNEALEAQPNATKSRLKIWNENYQIVDEFGRIAEKVQTITTKQDRHPNSGNIYFDIENGKSKYRFLTPRECFTLMGFSEKDYQILIDNNFITRGTTKFFSRDVLYKLAGNSIVVDVLEYVFDQMCDIQDMLTNYHNEYNLNFERPVKIYK